VFSNTIKTEWIDGEKRKQRLLEDVTFTDSKGVEWTAKTGDIIDGSSIPRFLWGWKSPFIGKHRRASVIHDVYCKSKERPHEATHKVYKEMCLFDGASRFDAGLMYRGIKLGGPKWK